ncbi:MAG TPA: hypothetical protein VIB00_01175 [Pyrinomonadaceae bacterium]
MLKDLFLDLAVIAVVKKRSSPRHLATVMGAGGTTCRDTCAVTVLTKRRRQSPETDGGKKKA